MPPQDLRLIAVIDENKATKKFGYQIGSPFSGKWHPLVIASAIWIKFEDAAVAAEKQLEITKKAVAKRKKKNIKTSMFHNFSGGPGAA